MSGTQTLFDLHLGDCEQILKSLKPNSIDAMITDPPAAIHFMGKDWDGNKGGRKQWIAWFSREMGFAIRTLKPGAHVFVWAIPKTSHWTAMALEDAGFEIRDVVTHVFGSGFPKSRNLGNGIGTALKPAAEFWILARKPMSHANIAKNVLKWSTGGINIDASRIGNGTTQKTRNENMPSLQKEIRGVAKLGEKMLQPGMPVKDDDGQEKLGMEGGMHKAGRIPGNNVQREASNGTSGKDGIQTEPPTDSQGNSPPQEPQTSRQPVVESAIDRQRGTTHNGTSQYPLPKDRQAQVTQSLGRFPANFVLSHHDECVLRGEKKVKDPVGSSRSGSNNPRPENHSATSYDLKRNTGDMFRYGTETVPDYDCHPECPIFLLDGQSGNIRSRHGYKIQGYTGGGTGNVYLTGKAPIEKGVKVSDSTQNGYLGGASRFFKIFYCPKPSKSERNAGLTKQSEITDDGRNKPIDNAYLRGKTLRQNNHPCVKSLKLMQYLIRMITPKGGTVLDPFMGSGSTGCAAMKSGRKFIGIEKSQEYFAIAKARIEHAKNSV